MTFSGYDVGGFFDELVTEGGAPRPAARLLIRDIESLPEGELQLRQQAAERALMEAGITFNVYSDNRGVEKTLPFDLVPRILGGGEWDRLERFRDRSARLPREKLHGFVFGPRQIGDRLEQRAAVRRIRQLLAQECIHGPYNKLFAWRTPP